MTLLDRLDAMMSAPIDELRVRSDELMRLGIDKALAHPALAQVKRFAIDTAADTKLPRESGIAIASSPYFGNWRSLELGHGCVNDRIFTELVRHPSFSTIEELCVHCGTSLGAEGFRALQQDAHTESLTSLRLDYLQLNDPNNAIAALFAWPGLRRLRRLSIDLSYNRMAPSTLAILTTQPSLAMEFLNLQGGMMEDEHATLFAKATGFAQLQTLSLPSNSLRVAGARALAAAPFPSLTDLNLWSNNISIDGVKAFGQRTGLPALRRLGAGNNGLGDELWEDWVDGNCITGGNWRALGAAQLKALFGDRPLELY